MKYHFKRHCTVGAHDVQWIMKVILIIPDEAALWIILITLTTARYCNPRNIQADVFIYMDVRELVSIAAAEFNDTTNAILLDCVINQARFIFSGLPIRARAGVAAPFVMSLPMRCRSRKRTLPKPIQPRHVA